jgi:hypothetical protein
MRLEGTILAAASRDDAVIKTVIPAVPVEQPQQFLFSLIPVNLLFDLGLTASVADTFLVDMHILRTAPVRRMHELRHGGRALIRHHASLTVDNLFRQAVQDRQFFHDISLDRLIELSGEVLINRQPPLTTAFRMELASEHVTLLQAGAKLYVSVSGGG